MTVTADILVEDAAAFGIDPSLLPAAPREEAALLIYPDNWDALNVFLALANAWTVDLPAMGGQPLWRGIPRTEMAAMLQLMKLWRQREDILSKLLIMESAALAVLNAKSA